MTTLTRQTMRPPRFECYSREAMTRASTLRTLTGAERGTSSLLDLRFLELDVLADDRIVLLEAELFRAGAWILLGDVEVARASCRNELDLLCNWFCHGNPGSCASCALDCIRAHNTAVPPRVKLQRCTSH